MIAVVSTFSDREISVEGQRPIRTITAFVLVAGVLLGIAPAHAQEDLPAWGTVPSPNAGFAPNKLSAVAVLSSTDVWAAGSFGDLLSPLPLVEHWDGTDWSVVPNPPGIRDSELLGVAAVSANDVWFVGGYANTGDSLIMHWDGTRLSVVRNPNPGTFNRLYAVTVVSATDIWAVGEFNSGFVSETLIEHWNGTRWRVVRSPTKSGDYTSLLGVTAVSASDIWAVGDAGTRTFAVHWDGARWRRVRTPSPGSIATLKAVSGAAGNDVWAVGDSSQGTLTAHWDGSVWSVVPSPDPGAFVNDLHGVEALAQDDVWAVGIFDVGGDWRTLALHWDGATWSTAPSPSPHPTLNAFYAVDADAGNDVWAVGEVGADVVENVTLVEQWAGASWTVIPSANAGTGSNQLNDVSALATDDIWAVGVFNGSSLTLHWDGAFFSIVTSPNLEFGVPLEGVVAVASDDVWAVGSSGDPSSIDSSTVTMHWDGAGWTIVPSPNPGGARVDHLSAVDGVASNDVWAVGHYYDRNLFSRTLILHWNGASWSVAPNNNCGFGELSGISVLSATNIWAIGGSLTCHYDGTSWTLVPSPQPRPEYNEIGYPLEDVSGAAPNDVWAVGARVIDNFKFLTFQSLIEHWDGTAWTADYNQPGSTLRGVEAISSDDVWAVGTQSFGGTLILHWDGGSWTTVPSPNPDNGGDLNGIDAVAADDLWAVGAVFNEEFDQRTLVEQAPSDTQGTVVGDTNVSGAIVSWFGPVTGSTETDPFGGYSVAGLPAGEYTFIATAAGCDPDSASVTVIAGATVTQDFQLRC
jgi:hypothetical protein